MHKRDADRIQKLSTSLITSDTTYTYPELVQAGPVITAHTIAGDVTITLPDSDTVPADGKIHEFWITATVGANKAIVKPETQVFAGGLSEVHLAAGDSVQLGVVNLGATVGWMRISNINAYTQSRRAATWAASNFSSAAAIPFDTSDLLDNSAAMDWQAGTNPSRITSQIAIRAKASYAISLDSTGGSTWNCEAWIRKNGSVEVPGSRTRTGNYGNEDQSATSLVFPVSMVATDYLELVIEQSSLTGNLVNAVLKVDCKL